MGADWIGAYVALNVEEDAALAALLAMDDKVLLATYCDVKSLDEADLSGDDEDEDKEIDIEAIRLECAAAVTACYDAARGFDRDGAGWLIQGTTYAVSGGPSWGDPPTDLCESIWLVDALGVTYGS